ncbi:helix-turn-helix domain-containing protein [Oceanobacillus luteolus]|uniref:Helix-turn-helix domain-containing protein n=1 Tax=Oceanobacillus luteolus TaxID=1274358 RepID=A0ABW4HR00_9BACI
MVRNIGDKIRYHRLKLKMTQSELSEGIISVSYLSKIEKGSERPSNEIVNLLSKRLDIDLSVDNNEKYLPILEKWFTCLLIGDLEQSIKLYDELDRIINTLTNTHLINLFEIHKISYFLLCRKDKEAEIHYHNLKSNLRNLNGKECYYWMKFSGDYFYSKLSYNKALDFYQQSEKNLYHDLFNKTEEENDLYYLISLTASKLRKNYLSIYYGEKALGYYRDNYELKKSAKNHILLGISYRRIGEWDKAKEQYDFALYISETIKNDKIYSLCMQNLGMLYSMIDQNDKAIEYYLKSYELKSNENKETKIVTISSLMKQYYKMGNLEEAKIWLNQGLKITKDMNSSDSVYVLEFKVYLQLIYGIESSFEELIVNNILDFLDDKELYYEKADYLRMLGDYFYKQKKYKIAADYYVSANETLTKI